MGPLTGLKVIEMKGIGPGPYAGMLLADMGAEVIVIDRQRGPTSISPPSQYDALSRGKKSIALNLKTDGALEVLMTLIEGADILIEGFRPGVAERLGFGPDDCLKRNPRLIYGRVTGWGQTGPLADVAGHDINYISISGVLAAIGNSDQPVPPLNLVGDFAGGSLFLVMGMLSALFERQTSNKGQVIDAAICEGASHLMSMMHSFAGLGVWRAERENNILDGAAHFYAVYQTSDDKFISIGSIEPQFYSLLLELTGLDKDEFSSQMDPSEWPNLKAKLAEVIKTKSQQEWCDLMQDTDVCFAPVLNMYEAANHHHNKARNAFIEINSLTQPAVAPKFDRSNCDVPKNPPVEGADSEQVLIDFGYSEEQIKQFLASGVIPS